MVIVDSTVWVDYLRGMQNRETEWLNLELEHQRLGLTDLILCEVLQGIRDDASFARVQRELCRFEVFETGVRNWLSRRLGISGSSASEAIRCGRPSTA
jgi:predicted nucleic acid-binding protein